MSSNHRERGSRRGLVVRLRRWLLGITVVLLALLAGFIGYARHRVRKALLDVPHLLGADIRSETNGFTYSQSIKGRTLFTIHAAKAIQRQNGKITLHDVQVTLYGEPGSNRTDSIRGAEFEYDQPNGVVRAVGETQLDFASPVGSSATTAQNASKRISVKATGLVFLEKLGVAATEGPIHFEYSSVSGDARGADYDADTGVLQLRHDVHLLSRENGHIEKVDADAASLDRKTRTVVLQQALLRDANDTLRAKTLHVQLRPQGAKETGSIQSMQAEGGVELVQSRGTQVTAPAMVADWANGDRPRAVRMYGGVQMHSPEQGSGSAAEALLALSVSGQPERITLLHRVRMTTARHQDTALRELTAEQIVAGFDEGTKKPTLRDLVASGSAKLVTTEPATASRQSSATTTITADTLHAYGSPLRGEWQVERVEGEGTTRIEQADGLGSVRTSTGDTLLAIFQPKSQDQLAVRTAHSQIKAENALASLVQQGKVVIEERRPALPAGGTANARTTQVSRATSNRAEYLASTGRTVFTGSPQITTTGLQVAADTIEIEQVTGYAEARGKVRGSYSSSATEPGGKASPLGEAVHFLASHAKFNQNEKQALLYGEGNVAARLWSNTGQVEAPVIDLNQKSGRLLAHGADDVMPFSVRTVLPATAAGQAAAPSGAAVTSGRPSLMRIASRSLTYTQGSPGMPGTAQFSGGARLDGDGGRITADSAIAELQPASRSKGGLMSDTLQKVVAQGRVRILQPGRSASGERLQYDTADQQFVLTGTSGSPPVIRDSVRGVVTGTRLIFHAGDDSVEVAGDTGRPVHTDVVVPSRDGTAGSSNRDRTGTGKAAKSKQ